MREQRVTKGIVLAAGDGDRLGSLTATCPKVLLPTNDGYPLIRYPIDSLAAAGIRDILIVVGYLGKKVVEKLGNGSNFGVRLQYVFNPDYLGGNATSVHRALDWVQGESAVLCMGDHLIEGEIIKRLLNRQMFNETLCVDYTPAQHHELAEATKVTIDSVGRIKNIGKSLPHWDAVDTGVFLLTDAFYQALSALVRNNGIEIEISDVIRLFINQEHGFDTCDVSGCYWADIDTKEDLEQVIA